jgi:lipoprotein signal peptidase
MTHRSYRWLLLTLAITGLTVDLVSKYMVFRWLYNESLSNSYDLIPGVFQFHVDYTPNAKMCDCYFVKLNGPVPPRVNHGALYGLGNEHKRLANGFFAAVSLIAAIAIGWWGMRSSVRRDWLLSMALGLILGGTVGNLFDRIVFGGVRDFLHWYLFEFPVFNVADSCLVLGAGLLLFHALFIHKKKEPEAPAAEVKPAQELSKTTEP